MLSTITAIFWVTTLIFLFINLKLINKAEVKKFVKKGHVEHLFHKILITHWTV